MAKIRMEGTLIEITTDMLGGIVAYIQLADGGIANIGLEPSDLTDASKVVQVIQEAMTNYIKGQAKKQMATPIVPGTIVAVEVEIPDDYTLTDAEKYDKPSDTQSGGAQ